MDTLASGPVFLRLLSGFELCRDGRRVDLPLSAQWVLAFLALRQRPLLRGHVAGMLWPDSSEAQAAGSLRSALWRLQRTGRDLIDPGGVHLALAAGLSTDVGEAAALAHRVLEPSSGRTPSTRRQR